MTLCKFFQSWATLALITAIAMVTMPATAASKGTIRIAENDWTGQLVDINLAKIILSEHMGYDVELVFADFTGQWVGLANGDLDVAMELWPSLVADAMQEWVVEKKKVEVLGNLGVVATAGWFVPTYVIKGDSARGIKAMAPDLKSYKDLNKYASLFARTETGDKGFCLDSVPTWELNNDKRIKNLGLNYKNVFAGTEGSLVAEIQAAYEKGEPLLICNMWEPHWLMAALDLTEIELPAYSDECFSSGSYACDFADDVLFNIARAGFSKEFPEAGKFFKQMNLTTAAQQAILLKVDVEGKTVEAAVREWMGDNESTWRKWMP